MTKLQKLLNGRNPTTGSGGGVAVPVGTSQVVASLAAAASLIVNNNNVAATARSEPQQLDASQFVYQPTQYDVLFGRGKPYQGHAGNVRFHKIVDVHKPRYSKARRHEKTEIAEKIVQYIQNDGSNAGRFLRRADGEEYWIEVTDSVARDKVSHALRGKPSSSGPGTKKRSSMSSATIKQKKSTTEPSKRSMKKVDTADTTQDNTQKKKLSSTPVVEMGPSELELELLNAAVRRNSINNALLASAAGGGSLYPPRTATSLLSKRPSLDLKSQLLASALLTDRQLLCTNIFNPQPLGSLQSLLGQAGTGGLPSSDPLNRALLFANNNSSNDPLLTAMNQLRRSSDSSLGGFYRY